MDGFEIIGVDILARGQCKSGAIKLGPSDQVSLTACFVNKVL